MITKRAFEWPKLSFFYWNFYTRFFKHPMEISVPYPNAWNLYWLGYSTNQCPFRPKGTKLLGHRLTFWHFWVFCWFFQSLVQLQWHHSYCVTGGVALSLLFKFRKLKKSLINCKTSRAKLLNADWLRQRTFFICIYFGKSPGTITWNGKLKKRLKFS